MQNSFEFDPAAALDKQIDGLLYARLDVPLSVREMLMIKELRYHKGNANACPMARMMEVVGAGEREIKMLASRLTVERMLPIGANRNEPCGYYLCVTLEDRQKAMRPYINEIRALARRVRAIGADHPMAALLGQLELALDKDQEAKHE